MAALPVEAEEATQENRAPQNGCDARFLPAKIICFIILLNEAYHYESKTRGEEDTQEKVRRFGEEIEFIRTRWITLLKKGDPYYNPNFSLKKCNYALKP